MKKQKPKIQEQIEKEKRTKETIDMAALLFAELFYQQAMAERVQKKKKDHLSDSAVFG